MILTKNINPEENICFNCFGVKNVQRNTTQNVNIHKEFLAVYFALTEFGHLMWGSDFPDIVFTDNRSVTRFFQTKIIPPPLWNACDFVLRCNFVIEHIAGAMDTAADFLSRAEAKSTEKLEMNMRNDVTTKAIEVK